MAHNFAVTVTGSTQGKFKGEHPMKGKEGAMVGLGFDYDLIAPIDIATGQSSGMRRHNPIKFIKEVDGSSPQLFQALITNESLKEVFFEFFQTKANKAGTGGGAVVVSRTIKLKNARVSRVHQYRNLPDDPNAQDTLDLEEIALTFMDIEIENKDPKTVASDTWTARGF